MTGYTRWFRRSRARWSSPLASCPRGALCESLCALFELSQPLCFPTVTRGRDSCALTLAASTCPSSCVFSAFFFLLLPRRLLVLLFFRLFFFSSSPFLCPRRVTFRVPSSAAFSWTRESFLSSFFFTLRRVLRRVKEYGSVHSSLLLSRPVSLPRRFLSDFHSSMCIEPISQIYNRLIMIIHI